MSNSQWIDRIYSRFLGRDISYIAGGGVILYMFEWIWFKEVTLFDGNLQRSLAYLIAAYILGLAASELMSVLHIAPKGLPPLRGRTGDEQPVSNVELGFLLAEGNHGLALVVHERSVALMHVGAAICGATAISALFLIARWLSACLNPQQTVALVISVVVSVLAALYTHWKNRDVLRERETLQRLLTKQGEQHTES